MYLSEKYLYGAKQLLVCFLLFIDFLFLYTFFTSIKDSPVYIIGCIHVNIFTVIVNKIKKFYNKYILYMCLEITCSKTFFLTYEMLRTQLYSCNFNVQFNLVLLKPIFCKYTLFCIAAHYIFICFILITKYYQSA